MISKTIGFRGHYFQTHPNGCLLKIYQFRCNMLKLPSILIHPKMRSRVTSFAICSIPRFLEGIYSTTLPCFAQQVCTLIRWPFLMGQVPGSNTCCSRQATGDDQVETGQRDDECHRTLCPWGSSYGRGSLWTPDNTAFSIVYSSKRTIENPHLHKENALNPHPHEVWQPGFLVSCCLAKPNDLQQAATRKGPAIDDPEDVALREGCESSDSTECREMTQDSNIEEWRPGAIGCCLRLSFSLFNIQFCMYVCIYIYIQYIHIFIYTYICIYILYYIILY